MAVNPKLIMMAVEVLSDENNRKKLLSIVFYALGLVMLILVAFAGLISGLLSVITNSSLKSHWKYIRSSLTEVFSGIETDIDSDVKNEVYSFMPDFSINLSKAAINNGFDGSSLILYDEDEIDKAEGIMTTYAAQLRELNTEEELEQYIAEFSDCDISFSDVSDLRFADDTGTDSMSDYRDSIKRFLYARAMEEMPTYEYICEERIIDEKKATVQTLTVTDGGETQTVEYICIGGGEVYLPYFLALYNVRQMREFLIEADEQAVESLDAQIEEAIGNMPESAEAIDEYIEHVWQGITDGKGAVNLNIFEASNLKRILSESVYDGAAKIETERTDDKLTITLETAGDDMWRQIFEIDEEHLQYVEQSQMAIELALDDAGISEDERTLSLDNMVQLALFQYFEGFFELPVSSSELKGGGNGMISQYGDVSPIHAYRYGGKTYFVPEKGVTLELTQGEVPVYANLLDCGDCIQSSFIFDVWDMENGNHVVETSKESRVYNYSAVTIAYVIDTTQFEDDYGFPFPSIDGIYSDGTITLYVEYSCLSSLELSENDIGRETDDVLYDGLVGYSHGGGTGTEQDMGLWYHYNSAVGEDISHVSIKTAFQSGEAVPSEYTRPHVYDGISASSGFGTMVNPRLWFKGFRTGMSDELFDTISAVEP